MTIKRLQELDGLKGLAIISIILTHIPITHIHTDAPSFIQPFVAIFFRSGGVGVYIFFLLTGFLMALLYPYPVEGVSFLKRRYLRLLPGFFAMVITLTMTPFIHTSIWMEIFFLLLCIFSIRIVWNLLNGQKKFFPIGTMLFYLFIVIQMLVAGWYMFYLLRVPPSVYYQVWDPKLRWIIAGVINFTMTLPFGQYIAQLDGVYWALIAEVCFYFLYPSVVAPILYVTQRFTSTRLKVILLTALFPFCYSLYLFSQRILRFSIIQPHLTVYFVFGAIIGGYYLHVQRKNISVPKIFSHAGVLLPSLMTVFGFSFLGEAIPKEYYPWFQMSGVIPLSIILLSLIGPKIWLHKFLTNSLLVSIGILSYSLFIVHSFVVYLVGKIYHSQSVPTEIIVSILIFTGSFFLAFILYYVLEKPYSLLKKNTTAKSFPNKSQGSKMTSKEAQKNYFYATSGISVCIAIFLYIAYKPPVSLFTIINREKPPSVLRALKGELVEKLSNTPKRISFIGYQDNLGMILMHLRNRAVAGVPDTQNSVVQLTIRLKDEEDTTISEHIYPTSEIIDSYYHPFGFPLQNSYGKRYFLESYLSRRSPSQEIELVQTEGQIIPVYFPDKKVLSENRIKASEWFFSKISEPFGNPLFWITLFYSSPFLIGLFIVQLRSKYKNTNFP